MLIILGIVIVCIFITLWCILVVCESNDMSLAEFFTGKDRSYSNELKIKDLEKRINDLEETVYIAPRD